MSGTRPFWALERDDLVSRVASASDGLSTAEAEARLRRDGPNAVTQDAVAATWRLLLRQVESPLVLILVFGSLVSMALREWLDATIILTIVLGSVLLGFWQEYGASQALAKLRRRLALNVEAMRDGAWRSVPVSTIVTGDIVRLSAGNLVPADAVLIEARDFLVSEAALTGESFPVEKRPGPSAEQADLAKRTNMIFLGTSVRSGTATAVVVETGPRTVLGRIAGRLAETAPETDFARGLRHFGYLLTRIMILVTLFVLAINILFQRSAIDSLLFAVALAVGLSPELLPAIVSVTLSAGARRLADKGVLVRRLEAIENLGSMDILCTDKTGTLTKGDVELSEACDVAGKPSAETLRLALVNARLETGIENPLDAAIVAAGEARGVSTDEVRKLDEIPYDFIRKRLTIVVAGEAGAALMITKGAVASVLEVCTEVEDGHKAGPLGPDVARALDEFCADKGREGYRVLALAVRALPSKAAFDRADEQRMTLKGLLLFRDPPKDGIAETIRDLSQLGIAVKIVSGDNRYTAAHVGAAIGLDPARILVGEDIARMKDEALWHLAETTDIFAEIDPQQKEAIVRALQKRGHSVGYMGDGINDAPSLLAADAGISVDQAVDVARESADIVLLQPDLDVLRMGVLGGRRTFANTLKYIKITMSANFGNMISMAAATVMLPFMPLLPKQILLNNFLSDIPSLAIATDSVDAEALKHAQRWDIGDVQRFMILFGLISTMFDFLTFFVLFWMFQATETLFQSAWFVESLVTELLVLLILRTRLPVWKSRPGRYLVLTTLTVLVVAFALPYLGEVSGLFNLAPIPGPVLAAMLAIIAGYAIATEFAKRLFFARRRSI
jgi:Mg2+-importing ATPase